MNHKLDINPIPENVIYINDPCLADTCSYELQDQYEKAVQGKTVSNGGVLPDDNVRIYVPLDLNSKMILERLYNLYDMLGSPYDLNEMQYTSAVGKIIEQLEIYDRVRTARNMKNAVKINSHLHSIEGIELARKIVDFLWQDEGNAECFPYDIIEELTTEFGLDSSQCDSENQNG